MHGGMEVRPKWLTICRHASNLRKNKVGKFELLEMRHGLRLWFKSCVVLIGAVPKFPAGYPFVAGHRFRGTTAWNMKLRDGRGEEFEGRSVGTGKRLQGSAGMGHIGWLVAMEHGWQTTK